MRRKMIDGANATLPELKREELVSKSYRFKLITPMFGGDVKSFEMNERTPVRSQSIKGQLRFWWRTMQGEKDKNELLKKETEIWGGSLGKKKCQSKVKVAVTNFESLRTAPVERNGYGVDSAFLAPYVLFPATKTVRDGGTVKLLTAAKFCLKITYPAANEGEVLESLILWTLFGGVGARTRRGCGSVYSEDLLKERDICSVEKLRKFLNDVSQGEPAELSYSRIKGAKLFCAPAVGSIKDLQKQYGEYRQNRKDQNSKHPGRSYWPEPDAIRRCLHQSAELHKPVHKDGIWFPRAAFGLPILTRFNTGNNGEGDPSGQVSLEPAERVGGKNAERWPSPFFIKQLKLGNELYNVMLVLNQKFPSGLILKQGRTPYDVPPEAKPSNIAGKVMNTEQPLNGRSIAKALADALGLKEA